MNTKTPLPLYPHSTKMVRLSQMRVATALDELHLDVAIHSADDDAREQVCAILRQAYMDIEKIYRKSINPIA